MSNYIDAHAHYIPPAVAEKTTFFKVSWSDLDRQLYAMDEAGIEKALLLYPSTDAHLQFEGGWTELARVYNDGIAEVLKKYPDRFIGAGILPMDNSKEFYAELDRFEDMGFRAISVASSYDGVYLDDDRFFPIFDFSESRSFPIHVHPQIINPIGEDRVSDPLLTPVLEYLYDVTMCIGKLMMSRTFLRFKRAKFIFSHYGGILPMVHDRFNSTYTMLRNIDFVHDLIQQPMHYFRNLYFDMSGCSSVAVLRCALEVVDDTHILFGSDFPANYDIKKSVATLDNEAISSEQKEKFLFRNMTDLLPDDN